MDLMAIFTIVRRHLWIVVVALVLTLGGIAGVIFGLSPQYESTAQYVLINPPAGPSDAEVQRDPALGRLNADNPYLRLPSPSVVVDVLAQRVSSDTVRQELVNKGADPSYQISGTNAVGSGMVISIVGTGRSAAESHRTIDLVTVRMQSELHDMQKVNGADDRFLIQALPVSPPTDPVRKVTGTIRSAIVVLAAGMVLLFLVISVVEAVSVRRNRARSTASVLRTDAAPSLESDTIVLPRLYRSGSATGEHPTSRTETPVAAAEMSTGLDDSPTRHVEMSTGLDGSPTRRIKS
jgi:capsular polysaccharide biosynthesis protein